MRSTLLISCLISAMSWSQLGDHSLKGTSVRSMSEFPGGLLAGLKGDSAGSGKVLISEDAGKNWKETGALCDSCEDVQCTLGLDGSTLLAGTWKNGLFRSTDAGISWQPVKGVPSKDVRSLTQWKSSIYAATTDRGIWRSEDKGMTWERFHPDSLDKAMASWKILAVDDWLFACTFDNGVVIWTDTSKLFRSFLSPEGMKVWDIAFEEESDRLYAVASGEEKGAVFLSDGMGWGWDQIEDAPNALYNTVSVSESGDLYVGSWDNGAWSYRGNVWRPLYGTYGHAISGLHAEPGRVTVSMWDDGVRVMQQIGTGGPKPSEESSNDE